VVVAEPLSAPLAALLLALEVRVRGVRCDISVLLTRLALIWNAPLFSVSFLMAQMAVWLIVKMIIADAR